MVILEAETRGRWAFNAQMLEKGVAVVCFCNTTFPQTKYTSKVNTISRPIRTNSTHD